jgi:hypothetical protein
MDRLQMAMNNIVSLLSAQQGRHYDFAERLTRLDHGETTELN